MSKPGKGVSKQVRIAKDGTEVEYWYVRVWGKSKYVGKGKRGFRDAVEARSKYKFEKLQAKRAGLNLNTQVTRFRTFQELMTWYMGLPGTLKKESSYKRFTTCAGHLAKHFGRKPVGSIEAIHLEGYREHRLAEGGSHGSVNLEINLIRMIYRKARANKLVMADAGPGEFKNISTSKGRRPITDEEYAKILKAAEKTPDFRDFIICAYETSMRAAEVVELRVMDVYFDAVIHEVPEGVVASYLDVEDIKSRKDPKERKVVPISEELEEVLRRRMEGLNITDRVFTNSGAAWKAGTTGQTSKYFQRICEKAEVPYSIFKMYEDSQGRPISGVDFHCLRVTRITKWATLYNDSIVRLASGHKNPQIFRDKYTKPDAATVGVLVGKSSQQKVDKSVTKGSTQIAQQSISTKVITEYSLFSSPET